MVAHEYTEDSIQRNVVNQLPYQEAGVVFLENLIEKHGLEVEEDNWTEENEKDETEIHLTYDSIIELWVFLLLEYPQCLQKYTLFFNVIFL